MRGVIAKEDKSLGSKLKLSGIVGSKVGPTRTTKSLEPSIIRFGIKELL
jgi:hypothetical protein